MMNSKVLIGGVVAVIVLAGALYYSYSAGSTDIPPVDTSTWKTYANTKHGFRLQYPSDWRFDTSFGDETVVAFSVGSSRSNPQETVDIRYYPTITDALNGRDLNERIETVNELIEKEGGTKLGMKQIDGLQAQAIEVQSVGAISDYYVLYVEKNGHLYEVSVNYQLEKPKPSPIERAMLESLRFTR